MQPTWEEDIRLAKLKIYRRDLIYLAENLPYPVSSGISSIFDRKKNTGLDLSNFCQILIEQLCTRSATSNEYFDLP